jgi:uncharacterized membrane protein YfcA
VTEPTVLVYAAVVVLLAYIVRGLAGFGSGLIAVPLLSMIAPVTAVVPVATSLDYLGSVGQSVRNARHVAWREQLLLIPFSLIGVVIGILFLRNAPTAVLSRALGAFVLVYAIYQLLPLPPLPSSRLAAIACGILGGIVGTLFGTGGPFYAIYFNLRGLDKSAFRTTFSANFLIDGGMRLVAYAFAGLLGRDTGWWITAGLPFMIAGFLIGSRLHVGITQRGFVRIVSVLLLASGTTLLLRR